MAQDFHATFEVGAGETGIFTLGTSGVALAAIQALNSQLVTQNRALEQRVRELERAVQLLVSD